MIAIYLEFKAIIYMCLLLQVFSLLYYYLFLNIELCRQTNFSIYSPLINLVLVLFFYFI